MNKLFKKSYPQIVNVTNETTEKPNKITRIIPAKINLSYSLSIGSTVYSSDAFSNASPVTLSIFLFSS